MGVDLEPLVPSEPLDRAAELFLPTEQAWVASQPEARRWQARLRLWTAKEAVLKALGQGFAFGLDQVELAPREGLGLQLCRLCGSQNLAEGWHLEFHERSLGGRTYLVAVAQQIGG